jgi:hypothetical protein
MNHPNTDQSNTRMFEFDGLYDNLAFSWESHQKLRANQAPIYELATSSARLDEARAEMWTWWKQNRLKAR